MSIITIVGAGMMGSAIGFPASDNGHEIRLVGTPLDREIIEHARRTGEHLTLRRRLPERFRYYQIEELDEALAGAELLVSGVSSFGVDWFLEEILPVIQETLPVLAVTKGMQDTEDGELIPYPHLYAKKLDRRLSLNAVGGPCTSYELADHDPTEVCFCGEDMEVLRRIKALFETNYYHVSLSTDVVGVECAVAMKNAYALAVTLAVGVRSARRALAGTLHYKFAGGADSGRVCGKCAGCSRLWAAERKTSYMERATCMCTVFGGRTRLIGTLLGRGLSFERAMEELEGVTLESIVIATRTARAVRRLIELGRAKAEDFPPLLHVDDIISRGAQVAVPWSSFETEETRA